jgi:flagellar hook-basal body complex protein FliE
MVAPVSALSGLLGAARTGPAASSATAVSGGPSFGQVLANLSTGALDTLKASEATAISGLQGGASVQEVVQSVMSAEETLQAALAIRDKAIAAYQDISRMQI